SLMINRGFKEVYQIDGGIVRYGEEFGDNGLWEGSLHVFDNRMKMDFSKNPAIIGQCIHCQTNTNNYENCAYPQCNDLVLICVSCLSDNTKQYHSEKCRSAHQAIAQ